MTFKQALWRPPIIAVAYFLAALGVSRLVGGAKLVGPPYHVLGFATLALGILLVSWALVLFRRKGTTFEPYGSPTALVATGPLRLSRNPMYLGITIALVGVAIVVGKLLPFLAAPAFVLTMHAHFIPMEEEKLERLLGQEYLDYKRRVRRWL